MFNWCPSGDLVSGNNSNQNVMWKQWRSLLLKHTNLFANICVLFFVLMQVFNVYTSSVRVQIKDLRSDYNPGQAFVVPRGK